MNNRISIATIDSPEFINLQPMDINPLMSDCESVKIFYSRCKGSLHWTE